MQTNTKKKKRNRTIQIKSTHLHLNQLYDFYLQKYQQSLQQLAEKTSIFFENLKINNLVCLGLGFFMEKVDARLQFQYLLKLRQKMQIEKVIVYDPVFQQNEISQLLKCNLLYAQQYEIDHETLLFMPHCDKLLYRQVFDKTSSLSIPLIGNSIQNYKQIQFLKGQDQMFKDIQIKEQQNFIWNEGSTAFQNTQLQILKKI